MQKLKAIEDSILWKGADTLMKLILIICGFLLTIVIGLSVFVRYVLESTLLGSDDILMLLAIWLYWMGGAYGSFENSHISADMTNILIKNETLRRKVKILSNGILVIISGIFAYWSVTGYMVKNIQAGTVTASLKMPVIFANSALTVSFILMFLFSIYHFVRTIHPRKDEKEGGTE